MNYEQLHIMVIEDHPTMLHFTVATLKRIGVGSVVECKDAETALSLVAQERPHLIVSDIHMKPMDGIEFLQRLRQQRPPIGDTPVIFMTGDASQSMLSTALPLGISGYIVKPPRLQDLRARIDAAFA